MSPNDAQKDWIVKIGALAELGVGEEQMLAEPVASVVNVIDAEC